MNPPLLHETLTKKEKKEINKSVNITKDNAENWCEEFVCSLVVCRV